MSVKFKNYYDTLGVARDASDDDIKRAFRKLAWKYHPDVAKDKPAAEEKFKEINEAHEVLGDPEKRKKYDSLDAEGRSPPPPGYGGGEHEFHFGGTGFSDFFEQYFSGGTRYGFPDDESYDYERPDSRSGSRRPQRGSDIEGDILVTLEESMHGTVRPLSMQVVNRLNGEVENRAFKVRIPAGATDGLRIRVPGHGEAGHDGAPAGDLFLRVRHAAHPEFSSRDADLFHDLDIAPWEAVLGTEIAVRTLDGTIKLNIPGGSENGRKLRVRGRGLPKGKTGERGDFYVVLNVKLPTVVSDEDRTLWEKLRDTSAFKPRPVE